MQRFTRTAFVEGLRKEVSGSFPFQTDETFEDWVARAQGIPNVSLRAMLAARMDVVRRRLIAQYSARKSAWIASARMGFEPAARKACYACNQFQPITQAHHVVPLNEQFDHGFDTPDHEHEWLCPNHHVILHLWIDRSGSDQQLGRRAAPSMADVPLEHFDKLMELVGRAGRTAPWPRLSPHFAATWSLAPPRSSERTP